MNNRHIAQLNNKNCGDKGMFNGSIRKMFEGSDEP